MCNVVGAMTPEEIDIAAKYYANKPPPGLVAE
jgi:hypothetical protein